MNEAAVVTRGWKRGRQFDIPTWQRQYGDHADGIASGASEELCEPACLMRCLLQWLRFDVLRETQRLSVVPHSGAGFTGGGGLLA